MASIESRNGKFRAVVSYKDSNGLRAKTYKTFDKKKDAKDWGVETEHKIKHGYDPNSSNKTFPEYYLDWFNNFKRNSLEETTIKKYLSWAKTIEKIFPDVRLKNLSTALLQERLDEFGETHSPLYMRNFVSTIKASLRDAKIDGALDRDIYTRLVARGNKDHQRQLRNFLSEAEFNKLHKFLYDRAGQFHEHPFYLIVLIGLETGARFGEIQAMNTKMFDTSTGIMTIEESYSTNISDFKGTKNETSDREVTFSPTLTEVLIEYIKGLDDFRFFTPMNTGTSSKYMRKLVEEVGITAINFHGLRHSHVSYLRYKEVDVEYIRSRVGHSSTRTTEDIYTHALPEYTDKQNTKALDILSYK